MIQQIEELSPELKFLRLRHADVLEQREVPIRVSRTLGDVATGRAELLHRRIGVLGYSLEGIWVEPCAGGFRSVVGIGDHVRPIGEKPGDFRRGALHRKIIPVEDRKRSARHRGHDPIDLPVAQDLLIPSLRLSPPRQAPLIAQHETVTGVEQGTASFRVHVEGVLRQIILSGQGF